MLKFGGQTKVIVDLPNGIYEFDPMSATGKTRLAKILRELGISGLPVMSYTYSDKVLRVPFNEVIKPGEQKLLMIDRYDLYRNQFNEQIKEFAKTGVVLIDIKGGISLECDSCTIIMDESSIRVER